MELIKKMEGEIMFDVIFYGILIVVVVIFIFTFVLMLSPKMRGKFLSKQIRAARYMMDESKDDIENISTNMADASKTGIEITTRAIKKGFTEDDKIYCKHCGSMIDGDSAFWKSCGKKI